MNKKIKINAISSILKENGLTSGFTIYDNGEIEYDENIQISEEQIQDKVKELEDEYNRTEYQRLRKAEYSKLNQMEMMYDDKVNGTDTWGEAIQAIKEKYPKPE